MYHNLSLILIILVMSCNCEQPSEKISSEDAAGKGFLDYFLGNRPKFCKCVCGKANNPSFRIQGGYDVPQHEYPWLVRINLQSQTSVIGTLINDRYVITAASQLIRLTPYDVKVTVGAHDRCYSDVTSTNHSVNAILIHPEFDVLTRANDIALLRLSNTINLDRWASPICLPKPDATYQSQVVQMLGWGQGPFAEEATPSCLPRRVDLAVLETRDCVPKGVDVRVVSSDKSCTGTGGSGSAICSADAGGPVQYSAADGHFELVGVLPDNNSCSATGSGLTLFTRLNVHFGWIFQNTRDSCFCVK